MLHDDGTLLAITARHFREQLFQASARDGIVRGEIRAAEEGRTVGCEKNGEWPAVQTRETLDGRLIALRDVRPLVAIHADRNEERVDQGADLGIGVDRAIGLRTPATCFAADIQQDRPVELRREHEGIASPRLPFDRLARGAREIVGGGVGHAISEWPALRDAGSGADDEQ